MCIRDRILQYAAHRPAFMGNPNHETDELLRIHHAVPALCMNCLLYTSRERFGAAWNKTYREMTFGEIYREMADYMKELMLIEEKQDEIVIRQAAGKIMGV